MSKRDKKQTLLLLDADHVMYIVCPNKKLYNSDGSPKLGENDEHLTENKTKDQCIAMADDYIKNVIRATKAQHYIGALTVGKCFRYEVKTDYKANRIDFEKPPHFDAVKEHLITKWKFVYHIGLEADDIIMASKKIYDPSFKTVIASTDKDILTTVGIHYDPKKLQWVKSTKRSAEKFFWSSMLMGDKADNIQGIPKVGPVTAEKILKGKNSKLAPSIVLAEYIKYFGEVAGIEEFYKNYKCLKMVDNVHDPSFTVPLPIDV